MKNESKQTNASVLALVCSTIALIAAVFFVNPSPAPADFAVKDRDYQLVTATVANGADALYVLDQRSGQIAVFEYEAGKPTLQLKGVNPIGNALGAEQR